jgi:hypothetical protein
MVGSWPCKVSSKIHINGRRVSEPVHEDKGKTTTTEPEDEKGPKRGRVVLSKGREVVGPSYSRLLGDAARVTDRREESGNPSRVDQVHQEYDTDRWIDRVTQDSQGQQTWLNVGRLGGTDSSSGGGNKRGWPEQQRHPSLVGWRVPGLDLRRRCLIHKW